MYCYIRLAWLSRTSIAVTSGRINQNGPDGKGRKLGALPGYLIRFVPLAFVPCRQVRSGETPSPLVVLQGLQDFTPTPEVPLTSPGLEPNSIS